jgi:hypothetical protein
MTVPTAMDCAASSIHHSPLSHSDQPPPPAAAAAAAASAPPPPAASCSDVLPSVSGREASMEGGSSSRHRPNTPSRSPAAPLAPSRSPNSSAASSATVSGCESMITLPRPAEVRCSPSARNPCGESEAGAGWERAMQLHGKHSCAPAVL